MVDRKVTVGAGASSCLLYLHAGEVTTVYVTFCFCRRSLDDTESGGADELTHFVAAVIDFWWGHLSPLTGPVKFNGWCSIDVGS